MSQPSPDALRRAREALPCAGGYDGLPCTTQNSFSSYRCTPCSLVNAVAAAIDAAVAEERERIADRFGLDGSPEGTAIAAAIRAMARAHKEV